MSTEMEEESSDCWDSVRPPNIAQKPPFCHALWVITLPPICQEGPSVISVHLLFHGQICPLEDSKFSPNNDVPRMVLYCLYYKELHCGMCSPPKCAYLLQCQLLLWKWKQMFLPIWMGLCKRRHGGIPILEWMSPIDFDSFFDTGHPRAHCTRSAQPQLMISGTSRFWSHAGAEMGLAFPVSWPQGHLSVH